MVMIKIYQSMTLLWASIVKHNIKYIFISLCLPRNLQTFNVLSQLWPYYNSLFQNFKFCLNCFVIIMTQLYHFYSISILTICSLFKSSTLKLAFSSFIIWTFIFFKFYLFSFYYYYKKNVYCVYCIRLLRLVTALHIIALCWF